MKLNQDNMIRNYKVLRLISKGQTDKTFLAECCGNPSAKFIIKERLQYNFDYIELINKVNSIQSESILHSTELFIMNNRLYQVFIFNKDACSLAKLIDKKAPIDQQTTVQISKNIAYGLTLLHSNGIVHRDIKPDNILVLLKNNIQIIDFSISEHISTKQLTAQGTIKYAAPEQYFGKVDYKSDIYSLGVTMFEMLTRKQPANYFTINLAQISSDISQQLISIIAQFTRISVDERPDSKTAFNLLNDIEKNN